MSAAETGTAIQVLPKVGNISELDVNGLRPHPISEKVYGVEPVNLGLFESIKASGVLEPIVVDGGKRVISGNSRLRAAKKAGIAKIPAVIRSHISDSEAEVAVLEANIQRAKSPEQSIREFREYKRIIQDQRTTNGDQWANLPTGKNRVGNQAAEKIPGYERRSLENGEKVLGAITVLEESSDSDTAEELRKLLNNKSINAALKRAQALGVVPRTKQAKRAISSSSTSDVESGGALNEVSVEETSFSRQYLDRFNQLVSEIEADRTYSPTVDELRTWESALDRLRQAVGRGVNDGVAKVAVAATLYEGNGGQ